MDVKIAFEEELLEEVDMFQPEGSETKNEINNVDLNSLMQVSRQWILRFNKVVTSSVSK